MDCPQCNVEMGELTDHDATLQRCGSCEGLWTDSAELNRILLHHNMPGLETMGGRPNLDEETGQCPVDLIDLIAVEGGPRHALVFETCEVCSGVWLQPEGDVKTHNDAAKEFVAFFKDFRGHK